MESLEHRRSDVTYIEAMTGLRVARNVLGWLFLAALVVSLAGFFVVRFWAGFADAPAVQAEIWLLRGGPTADEAPPATDAQPAPSDTGPATNGAQPPPAAPSGAPEDEVVLMLAQATQPGDAPAPPPPPQPATQPAPAQATEPPPAEPAQEPAPSTDGAQSFYNALGVYLPLAMTVGFLAASLLMFVLMMAVKVALVGRLAGVGALMTSFLWSLLLLALVVPWQAAFNGYLVLPGVFFTRADLIAATARITWGADPAWYDHVLYYTRFIVYPLVVVLVWLTVHSRFGRAMRQMTPPPPGQPDLGTAQSEGVA